MDDRLNLHKLTEEERLLKFRERNTVFVVLRPESLARKQHTKSDFDSFEDLMNSFKK